MNDHTSYESAVIGHHYREPVGPGWMPFRLNAYEGDALGLVPASSKRCNSNQYLDR